MQQCGCVSGLREQRRMKALLHPICWRDLTKHLSSRAHALYVQTSKRAIQQLLCWYLLHLLFVSSACEWEQRGISWPLGKLQSHRLLLIQALGSWSPAGPGPLKDCVGDSPAYRGTGLVPTYQLRDMGVSLLCCASVCRLRGKAGGGARVTAGPKRPHLSVCPGTLLAGFPV